MVMAWAPSVVRTGSRFRRTRICSPALIALLIFKTMSPARAGARRHLEFQAGQLGDFVRQHLRQRLELIFAGHDAAVGGNRHVPHAALQRLWATGSGADRDAYRRDH